VLKRIIGPETEEVTEAGRKILSENINRIILV
jgi:hypothetical protein